MSDGTNPAEKGLTETDAQNLLAAMWGKSASEASKIESISQPTPPASESAPAAEPEEPVKEETVPDPAPPAPEPEKVEPAPTPNASADPYAWVDAIENEDLKKNILNEIRARQHAEHNFRSANGRVNALRQEQLALAKKLAEKPSAPAPSDPAANPQTPRTPKEWEELIEQDRSLAQAVEARLNLQANELRSQMEQHFTQLLEAKVGPLYQHQSQQYLEREAELLRQAVPNYTEVTNSPEWHHWVNTQSPENQKRIYNATNHAEVIDILQAFGHSMHQWGWVNNSPYRQPTQQPNAAPVRPVAPTEQADKIAREREEKLKATPVQGKAPTPSPSPANQTHNITADAAEDMFRDYYARIKKGEKVSR